MTEEDLKYSIECGICDVTSIVIVEDVDEKPCFCPMCGEELEV